ncbi:MAG: FliI/YscN family ATPase [Paracoccaceae bacterium]
MKLAFEALQAELGAISVVRPMGRVNSVEGSLVRVAGLSAHASLGDRLEIRRRDGEALAGEVLRLESTGVAMLTEGATEGVSLDDPVILLQPPVIAPTEAWLGRVIDPLCRPLDEAPLMRGPEERPGRAAPPPAATRRGLGPRLDTGMVALNTLLPIVRGQRMGLFAGSGVGKSSLLAQLARSMQADMVVLALIGERGRELRDFVETVLGPEGMRRAVVVAATSDAPATIRRRCAQTAMSVAEHFRDEGRSVLLLADSITRFAEAHREVALAIGEAPALRGYPASTAPLITSLCERAGPGAEGQGDITAVFTVLVAGSDMEEPLADIMRGVLDGHVVLDRAIAERGRYPAIDVLRSVSRSLPGAASEDENALIRRARQLLGAFEASEAMIRAGLYAEGSDPLLDQAIRAWPALDAFLAEPERHGIAHSFERLRLALRKADSLRDQQQPALRGGESTRG